MGLSDSDIQQLAGHGVWNGNPPDKRAAAMDRIEFYTLQAIP